MVIIIAVFIGRLSKLAIFKRQRAKLASIALKKWTSRLCVMVSDPGNQLSKRP